VNEGCRLVTVGQLLSPLSGLFVFLVLPTACAVGFIISPLCGCAVGHQAGGIGSGSPRQWVASALGDTEAGGTALPAVTLERVFVTDESTGQGEMGAAVASADGLGSVFERLA
jgi:hypothetical protein